MAGLAVRESMTVAGRAERARAVRAFVHAVLGPAHPRGDDAALLNSSLFTELSSGNPLDSSVNRELVTNAVAATQRLEWIPTPPVRLWLLADSTQVLIAVWDANPRLPVRTEVDELAESGRGLLLVESLATHWDAYPTPHDGGKVVRALCALSQPVDG